MPMPGRRLGSDAPAFLKRLRVTSNDSATMTPKRRTGSESMKTAAGYPTESATEMSEFRWEGHWEVWEREWGGARWIWD